MINFDGCDYCLKYTGYWLVFIYYYYTSANNYVLYEICTNNVNTSTVACVQ